MCQYKSNYYNNGKLEKG